MESLADIFLFPNGEYFTREEVLNGEAAHMGDDYRIIPIDHPDYITYRFF